MGLVKEVELVQRQRSRVIGQNWRLGILSHRY
jgi:hypothetical protein